jgi:hypothetical protein
VVLRRSGHWVLAHPSLARPIKSFLQKRGRLSSRLRWLMLGHGGALSSCSLTEGPWGAGEAINGNGGLSEGRCTLDSVISKRSPMPGVNASQRGPLEAHYRAYLES